MRHPTKTVRVTMNGTEPRSFTLFDTGLCPLVCQEIFDGSAYPTLPDDVLPPNDVEVIIDVGANIGASVLWWMSQYPNAEISAYEPCHDNYSLLIANVPEPRVHKANVGWGRADEKRTLFHGPKDDVEASCQTITVSSEPITVVTAWQQIDDLDVDILKIDTEGCEYEILSNIEAWLEDIKVLYVEYHSEEQRLCLDEVLHLTHTLWYSHSERPHRGELCYVRKDLIPEKYDQWEIKG